MRKTSGLGDPPLKDTAPNCLPVRSTIVSSGWSGTGLIGLTSSLAINIMMWISVSVSSDSGIRSKKYSVVRTTRG